MSPSKPVPAKKKAASRRKPAAASRKARPAPRRRRPPRKRVEAVLVRLAEHDPQPRCALEHAGAWELLCATILSAQCTDGRVNQVTPALFARYPGPREMAAARPDDVEELIHSTGFFRNKTKSLIGMSSRLMEAYDGAVPSRMEDLLTLPGVARKTANVVLGECFGVADGVVVDTHVARIAGRLGFSGETDPVKIERDLMRLVPREQWIAFAHRLIRFGRTVCGARKPRCDGCILSGHCPRIGVDPR